MTVDIVGGHDACQPSKYPPSFFAFLKDSEVIATEWMRNPMPGITARPFHGNFFLKIKPVLPGKPDEPQKKGHLDQFAGDDNIPAPWARSP